MYNTVKPVRLEPATSRSRVNNISLTTALPAACLVNSEDPDKMLHYAAFHLGLHCLLLKTKLIFRERNTFCGERGILA